MKKGIKIGLIITFLAIIGVGSYFIGKTLIGNYLIEQNTIEEVNLKEFVSTFNKNLNKNKVDIVLTTEETEVDTNKTYWIDVEENIDIAILMDKISDKPDNDTVRITGLAFKTGYEDMDKINTYLKVLIKTNNPKLSNSEVNKMIENANNMKNSIKKDENETSKTYDYKGLGIDKNINSETTIYRIVRYNEY